MNDLPKILGLGEIPPAKVEKAHVGRKGRRFSRNAERTELVRQALARLERGKALVVECPSKAEMQTFRCDLLVAGNKTLMTRSRGLQLLVFARADKQQPRLF